MPSNTRPGPNIESLAIIAAIIAAALGFGGTFLVLGGRQAPLSSGIFGGDSIASIAIVVVALTGAGSFIWGYIRHADGGLRWRRRHPIRRVLDVLGLTVTGAGVAVMLVGSLLQVSQLAFVGLVLDPVASAALVAVLAAVSAYVLALIAGQLTTSTLATLLALFLVAGVFTSMLTADDPTWWRNNFSALGMGLAVSSIAFNLTVAIAGLAILTLADYLTIDLRSRRGPRGINLRGSEITRGALVLVGVALVGLGLVPVNVSVPIHNTFSISALVGFAALMLAAPILLRGLPWAFIASTLVFTVVLVASTVLFARGAFNLTALELIAVSVIFTWLILFTRNASTGRDLMDAEPADGSGTLDAAAPTPAPGQVPPA